MHPIWKTNSGKLIIGTCGTQVGLVFTCAGLTIILLLGMVGVSVNALSLNLSQEMAGLATPTPVETPSSSSEVESLLNEVDLLLGEVAALQTDAAATPVPVTPPPAVAVSSAQPVVIANQNGVSLYSGPGREYEQVGILPLGESLEIVGRNLDSTWWLVARGDGLFAWVSNIVVATFNVYDSLPVITTPSQLAQVVSSGSSFALASPTVTSTPTTTPTPTLPPGTPTPNAEATRLYVESMVSYQKVKANLLVPPVSASFSPDGSQVAMTERIKMYTFTSDGAHTDIWLEDNDEMGPVGNVVWSPDGKHIAFVVGFKRKYCRPCRAVGLFRPSDGTITYLKPPREDLDTGMPRWTQDGRLLINAHLGEPADGEAHVYNIYGESQEATGVYVLSSSHEGQKWYPWKPGRIWRAGVSERADSYNSD